MPCNISGIYAAMRTNSSAIMTFFMGRERSRTVGLSFRASSPCHTALSRVREISVSQPLHHGTQHRRRDGESLPETIRLIIRLHDLPPSGVI